MTSDTISRRIDDLFSGFAPEIRSQLSPADLEIMATAITSDSRQVIPGAIFVAVGGTKGNGHEFIRAAEQAGAALIVGEELAEGEESGPTQTHMSTSQQPHFAAPYAAPYIHVPNSRLALARLAAGFYGNPSHGMIVVGITGTSGKTTTTYLLESILLASGHKVGVIGTINIRHGNKIIPSELTTPGPVELQRILAQMKSEGCSAVVMEVSSHALKQNRVAHVAFNAALFTNLSPEHLDFHADMEDYFNSKAMLFTDCLPYSASARKKPIAVINSDDAFGARLLQMVGQAVGFSSSKSDLTSDISGTHGEVGGVKVDSPLMGTFNTSNILAAVTAARALGLEMSLIARGISDLKLVPGRLERVDNSKGINVLVDYAHKPDALEKVLKTLSAIKGRHCIISVFGCGGDRDRKKRPLMGQIAVSNSDYVFITSDNPRTESPQAIIDEIMTGAVGASNFVVEPDREKAIVAALRLARTGDIVLIAGKGHEDYQIIADPDQPGKTRKIHFDDREVVARALLS